MNSRDKTLIEALEAVQDLIDSSHGIAGLHLNGDVAYWESLLEGGAFEEWLAPLSKALRLIEAQPEPTGMVVPLDAFTALLECLEQKKLHDPDDPDDGLAQFIVMNKAIAESAVPAGNQWQPIETFPAEDGNEYLFLTDDGCELCNISMARIYEATHWMPLPEPPAQQEAGDE